MSTENRYENRLFMGRGEIRRNNAIHGAGRAARPPGLSRDYQGATFGVERGRLTGSPALRCPARPVVPYLNARTGIGRVRAADS